MLRLGPFIITSGLLFLASFNLAQAADAPASASPLEYNRDIRPILSENCFACHGPDSAARKADLRLDQRPAALENEAFVPGRPDESELIRRIVSTDPKLQMPPAASHKKLTPAQKDILRRWVAAGAEYQAHWSLIAPKRSTLPAVKNEAWVRNPLDRFVLSKLESLGLSPAPEADRRTLARRASLDLTGLPPSLADVEAFVHDTAPNAYERYVDRLMSTDQWGEHRARYWLDVARFADTHGIHFDNYREIWSYRDWVIDAFNRNMPFDQFTVEQIAGDLLPNRSLDQLVASGFNRCNITTNEGGAIAEEYLVLYARDRTETVAQVWLGLTAGCAVCHDHKFDPLSQREFYELSAFFNNTTQNAMDGNIKDTPPVIVLPKREDRARWTQLEAQIAAAKKQQDERATQAKPDFDKWVTSASIGDVVGKIPLDGLQTFAPLSGGKPQTDFVLNGLPQVATVTGDGAWDAGHIGAAAFKSTSKTGLELANVGRFDKDKPFSASLWVKIPANARNGTLLSQWDDKQKEHGWEILLSNARLSIVLSHQAGSVIRTLPRSPVTLNQWLHVVVTYNGNGKASGLKLFINGASQDLSPQSDTLAGSFRTDAPLVVGRRKGGAVLEDGLFQDLRLYTRVLNDNEVSYLQKTPAAVMTVAKLPSARSPVELTALYQWWLSAQDDAYRKSAELAAAVGQEMSVIKDRGTIAHVMTERAEPPMAYILFRGDYDKRRDQVKAGTPKMLPPLPNKPTNNRLDFAKWLLTPENPLTARVTVNRFWQEVFGNGLVRTSGDFGVTGETPSHPELLDWLAVEFRESKWDVKKFYRTLLTSATYRQSAAATPVKLEKDSQNCWLSRGPRFRLDAEMLRDYALAASGTLVRKIGGPSVKPYQPDGVWEAVAMIGSNTRDYRADAGESLYRRSMYTFWKRSAPPASMDIFNAPSRETCAVRRERTNTPLQALATLNDPQFVEAARNLAQAVLAETPNDDLRIDSIARRLLSRPFRPDELAVVRNSLKELVSYYREHSVEAAEVVKFGESKANAKVDVSLLAAWTMLANELMNLDEVLNK